MTLEKASFFLSALFNLTEKIIKAAILNNNYSYKIQIIMSNGKKEFRMIKKILFPITVLILALPLTAQPIPPHLQKHDNPPPPYQIPENDLDLRLLNLSEEQNIQINKITEEYKKKIDLIILDLNRNKLDFDEMMINDNYDFDKLKELIENRKKLESNILVAFLERDLKVKDLLTKEQWNIFKKNFPKGVNFINEKDKMPKNNKDKRNEKKKFKN